MAHGPYYPERVIRRWSAVIILDVPIFSYLFTTFQLYKFKLESTLNTKNFYHCKLTYVF